MPASVLSCAVTGPGDAVEVWDPRARRGSRYPLLAVVRAAACAVAAGARSYSAIGQWLLRAPPHTLARLGSPARGVLGVRPAPSKHTVRRIIEKISPRGLQGLLSPASAPAGRPRRLAADGKSARGLRSRDRQAAHLLAVLDDTGRVLAQLRVPDKTNEIPCLRDLLGGLDIAGALVTADALHTQVATARFLVVEKKAHFVLTVKANPVRELPVPALGEGNRQALRPRPGPRPHRDSRDPGPHRLPRCGGRSVW